MHMPLAERLDRLSEPRVPGRCQLWLGGKVRGYGKLKWRGRMVLAHRATWECEKGPIPEGMDVLHTCDTPACRNIDHLFLGTQADNVADMVSKGRKALLRGEAHGRAKLTEAETLEIRSIENVPQWVIGAMYGLAQTTVGQIRRGERWRYLEAA